MNVVVGPEPSAEGFAGPPRQLRKEPLAQRWWMVRARKRPRASPTAKWCGLAQWRRSRHSVSSRSVRIALANARPLIWLASALDLVSSSCAAQPGTAIRSFWPSNVKRPQSGGQRGVMRAYEAAFALVAFTLGALPVGAQDVRTVEVTPYVAFGSAAASLVGAAVTFPVSSTLGVETDVAYRHGEGRIHALSSSVSLLYFLPRVGQAIPYVVGGVGLSQYGAPVFSANGRPIGTETRVALTVNAGGGLKMPMNEKMDLRTDARWFKSFGRLGSEQFHVAQGISFDVGKR